MDYLTTHKSLSSIRHGFEPGFVNYKKGALFAHGRWFSPASSTAKTGLHDIAEILLKVALNTINPNPNQKTDYKKMSNIGTNILL